MINQDGYRLNVGIIICNQDDKLFWGQRASDARVWQFPQGGIEIDESEEHALYRELAEEVGLKQHDVTLLAKAKQHHRYRFPPPMVKTENGKVYIGQQQRYFLLRLHNHAVIKLNTHHTQEFSTFKWVDYWHPIHHGSSFKRSVYQTILEEFKHHINQKETPC